MVADTKKGRPKSILRQCINPVIQDKSTRTEMNRLYAMQCILLNEKEFKPFFIDIYGNIKKQGIAEQIGRIKEMNITSDEDLIELTQTCINEYKNGKSVKAIESNLREFRKRLK